MKLFIILILLVPSIVFAGQLHYEFISLASAQTVVFGTLIAIGKTGYSVKIKVKKVWSKDSAGIVGYGDEKPYKAGNEYEIELPGPTKWDDPGESPIEMRFANYQTTSDVKVGEDIFIASSMSTDIIPANKNLNEKLDLIFSKKPFKDKEDQAYQYLYDQDLYPVAMKALVLKGDLNLEKFYSVPKGVSEKEVNNHFWDLMTELTWSIREEREYDEGIKGKKINVSGMDLARACIKAFEIDKIEYKVNATNQVIFGFKDKKIAWEYLRDHIDKEKYERLYSDILHNLKNNVH